MIVSRQTHDPAQKVWPMDSSLIPTSHTHVMQSDTSVHQMTPPKLQVPSTSSAIQPSSHSAIVPPHMPSLQSPTLQFAGGMEPPKPKRFKEGVYVLVILHEKHQIDEKESILIRRKERDQMVDWEIVNYKAELNKYCGHAPCSRGLESDELWV